MTGGGRGLVFAEYSSVFFCLCGLSLSLSFFLVLLSLTPADKPEGERLGGWVGGWLASRRDSSSPGTVTRSFGFVLSKLLE